MGALLTGWGAVTSISSSSTGVSVEEAMCVVLAFALSSIKLESFVSIEVSSSFMSSLSILTEAVFAVGC